MAPHTRARSSAVASKGVGEANELKSEASLDARRNGRASKRKASIGTLSVGLEPAVAEEAVVTIPSQAAQAEEEASPSSTIEESGAPDISLDGGDQSADDEAPEEVSAERAQEETQRQRVAEAEARGASKKKRKKRKRAMEGEEGSSGAANVLDAAPGKEDSAGAAAAAGRELPEEVIRAVKAASEAAAAAARHQQNTEATATVAKPKPRLQSKTIGPNLQVVALDEDGPATEASSQAKNAAMSFLDSQMAKQRRVPYGAFVSEKRQGPSFAFRRRR